MALDGITLHFIKDEIAEKLIGARVERVNQPSRLELVFNMRTRNGAYKLLMSAEPSSARVHLTSHSLENPQKPPMLCMLFRKKLTGAILRNIRQSGLDRILFFDFDAVNEIGDKVNLSVCVEIMAQHSNIILIGNDGKIIDAVKRVDENKSSVREILPSVTYVLPPQQKKCNILKDEVEDICTSVLLNSHLKMSKSLLFSIEGSSPLMCREIAYEAFEEDLAVSECDSDILKKAVSKLKVYLESDKVGVTVLFDVDGKPYDFSIIDIKQYGRLFSKKTFASASEALDVFYYERDLALRMKVKASDIIRILNNTTERLVRKIANQRAELQKCDDKDMLKTYAELISANQYKLSSGCSYYEVENYYDNNRLVKIPVNPALSPAKNSQKYYKEYKKAHTAEKMLADLIESGEQELSYIDSVKDSLMRAETESEIASIRNELVLGGFIKKHKNAKQKQPRELPPLEYVTSEGFRVLVGRNNLQNDKLTFKTAKNYDMWFHTKGVPGSHTILVSDKREFTDLAISEAAIIAACNSSAKENTKVPVDYTLVKNVKKPSGALPGKVVYYTNNMIYVIADKTKITEKKSG